MSIARGLFRLWLVVSVFWIAAIAWSARQVWEMATAPTGTGTQALQGTKPVSNGGDTLAAMGVRLLPPQGRAAPAATHAAPDASDEKAPDVKFLLGFVELALLPPLLLFMAGAAIVWVGRGFLRRQPRL